MERIKGLNHFQRIILMLVTAMLVGFTIVYGFTFSRLGYAYADHILVPSAEKGTTCYSATIRGKDAVFTVTPDHTVTFQYGDKVYGPYTAKEDPTAVPEDRELAEYMTGVEILDADQVYFRGGVLQTGEDLVLFDEDGLYTNIYVSYGLGDGTLLDMNGNVVDEMEPTAAQILELMKGPTLTRKGEWAAWVCGVIVCIATAVSILYADELFRRQLSYRIRDPESAEPSDWEVTGRYISWVALPVMALVVFVVGLL